MGNQVHQHKGCHRNERQRAIVEYPPQLPGFALVPAMHFLAVFDAALRSTLHIVDMPNRRAALLVRLILQNKGELSKGKRTSFAEITDQEVERIETAVWGIWLESQQEKPSENS